MRRRHIAKITEIIHWETVAYQQLRELGGESYCCIKFIMIIHRWWRMHTSVLLNTYVSYAYVFSPAHLYMTKRVLYSIQFNLLLHQVNKCLLFWNQMVYLLWRQVPEIFAFKTKNCKQKLCMTASNKWINKNTVITMLRTSQ